MRFIHRVGAALAAASLIAAGAAGPSAAALRPLTDEERAAAREKATRARADNSFTVPALYAAPERSGSGLRDGSEYTGF